MTSLAPVAVAILAALTALAIRLLIQARRGGRGPELVLGLFFLAVGPLGFLPTLLPVIVPAIPWPVAQMRMAGVAGITLGCWLMAVFTWRVFRPHETWAAGLVAGIGLALVAGYAFRAVSQGFEEMEHLGPAWVLSVATRAVCFLWSGLESLRYWSAARRRVRLGLLDALTANRFLLWSVWSGGGAFVLGVHVVRTVSGLDPSLRVGLTLVGGVVCGAAIWLTFFPPATYRRLVERRAPASDRSLV